MLPGHRPAQVTAALQTLAASPICALEELPHRTHEDRPVHALTVSAADDPSSRPTVLIVGGVHAREIITVDAVLSFATKLVEAHDAVEDAVWPAIVDPKLISLVPPVFLNLMVREATIPERRVSAMEVGNLLQRFRFVFVPMANPDGRAHVFADPTNNKLWRGNRNIDAAQGGSPYNGVDINRNFDVAWDIDDVYSFADAELIRTPTTEAPWTQTVQTGPPADWWEGQIYRGPGAGSEPETQNLQGLIEDLKPSLVLDVHGYGRWILVPWATAAPQTDDPTRTLLDPSLGRASGGSGRHVTDLTYREFTPDHGPEYLDSSLTSVAARMAFEIVRWAGPDRGVQQQSRYQPIRTARWVAEYREADDVLDVLPTPGGFTSYTMLQQFTENTTGHTLVYTLECGSAFNGEDGWTPPVGPKYDKVEREVHAAIIGMLAGYRGSRLGRDALGGAP